jgi:amidohydrolase
MRLTDDDLIAIRRDLHMNPELSHDERRTAGVVQDHLADGPFSIRTGVAGHGVVADLVGDEKGPTLLYRADMDALPIQEISNREYRSQNAGVMHACGHDVHTTIGIGVARALAERQGEIHGTVRFVFQPAEEAAPPPGQSIGAEKMVEEGVLDGVDAAFALHVMPLLDAGGLGFTGGPVWAASDLFDIEVHGSMAHGAYPHEGRDPILAGAAIVQALQQIPSRIIDAREACVLSVCRVQSGTAYNIIPDRMTLQGLLRTLDPEVRERAMAHAAVVVESVAAAHGCTAELRFVRGTHLTANHPALERFVGEVVKAKHPTVGFSAFQAQMGAEDFAAFSRRIPGCYLFLGVRNEARGITSMIHTPGFDVDEAALGIGVRTMSDALIELGGRWDEVSAQL